MSPVSEPTTDPAALGYHAMRLRWCRLALLAFLRRWGIYVLTATAVLAAGADGFVQIVSAASAWLVLPLFYAAGHGAWLLPALLLQAALGTGCVWGMRSALWPARWAEAERALPLAPRQTQLSDLFVVLIALLPLALLYAAGAASLLGHRPDWLQPARGRAVAALLSAFAASVACGVALLQRLRRPARVALRQQRLKTDDARRSRPMSGGLRVPDAPRWPPAATWLWALLWLPLWRGPARRTGNALLLGSTLALLPALALLRWPPAAPWWLAGFALLALLAVTRVDTLAREEITPLLDACCALPLPPRRLTRARAALGLLPMLPGLALLCAVCAGCIGSPLAGLRTGVLAAYAVACLASGAFEVLSAPAAAADKAGRWLFTLVLCICLATEVVF